MKIIIFAGELSKGRKTEIIPISTSRENSVGPSKEQKQILLSSEKNERPAFYTDRYFSSNFLSDSIPLSQMIRRNWVRFEIRIEIQIKTQIEIIALEKYIHTYYIKVYNF